jgi:hypothetical protein
MPTVPEYVWGFSTMPRSETGRATTSLGLETGRATTSLGLETGAANAPANRPERAKREKEENFMVNV